MQFVRYDTSCGGRWGVLSDGSLYPFDSLPVDEPRLEDIGNPAYRRLVERTVRHGSRSAVASADRRPLAPVPRPGKIVCTALNYQDHAAEQDRVPPEQPVLFSKSTAAVTHPGSPIVLPDEVDQVDYEVELAIVVGRTAYRVDARDAHEYVAGYTILNDVTARDAVAADGQNFRGKSYPTFAPLGPTIVAGDGFDPDAAAIELRVNGEVRQSSNTSEFIFDAGTLFEYVSHVTPLEPGDIIGTGTPAGVGMHRSPPGLLEPNDEVEAEIAGIGVLDSPVERE